MVKDRLNIIAIWIRSAVNVLVPFLTVPVLISALGVEVFGVWQFTGQLAAALLLFDLGVTNASIRVFSQVEGSERELPAIKASFVVFLFSSLFLIAIAWPGDFLLQLSMPNAKNLFEGFPIFLGCFFYAALSILMRGFTAYLFSRHRFVFVNLTESLGGGAKLIVLYTLYEVDALTLGTTFLVIFGIQLTIQLLQSVYALRLAYPSFRFSIVTPIDRSSLRYLFSHSMASVQVSIGSLILNSGFIFFLGLKNEFEMVATVSLAAYLMISLTPFMQTFVAVMVPRAAKVRNKKDIIEVFQGILIAIKLFMVPLCCLAAFIMVLGPWIFGFWLEKATGASKILNELSVLVSIMLAAYSLTFSANFLRAYVLGAGNHRLPGYIDIFSSLGGLFLSILAFWLGGGVFSFLSGYCGTLLARLVAYFYWVSREDEFKVWSFVFPILSAAKYLLVMFAITIATLRYEHVILSGDRQFSLLGPCILSIVIVLLYSMYQQRMTYQTLLLGR